MDLPDLTSSDLILGFDIVASWQLEKIQEVPLWEGWPSDELLRVIEGSLPGRESLRIDRDGIDADFLRLTLYTADIQDEADDGTVKNLMDLNHELEWSDGRWHMLVWTCPPEPDPLVLWSATVPELRAKSTCNYHCSERAPLLTAVSL